MERQVLLLVYPLDTWNQLEIPLLMSPSKLTGEVGDSKGF